MEIKQVWQEEMHLVVGDHNIVKQEENKDFSITEEKSEHERVAITPNLQTSEELHATFCTNYLLKESVDVGSAKQHVKEKYSNQLQAVSVTVNTLPLEEGRKCSPLERQIGFVNECQPELYEVPSGIAIYRRPFRCFLERNEPAKENTSNETKAVNMPCLRRLFHSQCQLGENMTFA